MKERKPHLVRYRSQLREALRNPALSESMRAKYAERLDRVTQELSAVA